MTAIIPPHKMKQPIREHITFHSNAPSGQSLRFEIVSDTECSVIAEMKTFPGYIEKGVAPIYGINPEGWFNNDLKGHLTIPSVVEFDGCNYKVTRIDIYAFKNCPNLDSVVVPGTIKIIGKHTFLNSKNIQLVQIHQELKIDEEAVENCPNLKFKID